MLKIRIISKREFLKTYIIYELIYVHLCNSLLNLGILSGHKKKKIETDSESRFCLGLGRGKSTKCVFSGPASLSLSMDPIRDSIR